MTTQYPSQGKSTVLQPQPLPHSLGIEKESRVASMDLKAVKREIIDEALGMERFGVFQDTAFRSHKKIRIMKRGLKPWLKRMWQARYNRHDILHHYYQIPLVGTLSRFVACILLLPSKLSKVNGEIKACNESVLDSECRMMEQQLEDYRALVQRLKVLEKEVTNLKSKELH